MTAAAKVKWPVYAPLTLALSPRGEGPFYLYENIPSLKGTGYAASGHLKTQLKQV
ncbi:hypothetical protein GCM10007389_11780 [Pontibacter akesuensis]|nr:hypothetical protein GCM10007389_11780 [Pontibacter akesuensis]